MDPHNQNRCAGRRGSKFEVGLRWGGGAGAFYHMFSYQLEAWISSAYRLQCRPAGSDLAHAKKGPVFNSFKLHVTERSICVPRDDLAVRRKRTRERHPVQNNCFDDSAVPKSPENFPSATAAPWQQGVMGCNPI